MTPLAERVRPHNLDELLGQDKIVGENKIITQIIKHKKPYSLILWGPAGTGKTTIARIIASSLNAETIEVSAVTSGKQDLKNAVEQARQNQVLGQITIVFIDEIHRFNKAQQDYLLPFVESGLIYLIGATTENPSFEIITPLLSRTQLIILEPLSNQAIKNIVKQALKKLNLNKIITAKALEYLAIASGGDARRALGILELALDLSPKIDFKTVKMACEQGLVKYDKQADNHYELISAFIKSMRGSDEKASLYYLIRMLEGGEDPKFIARRMIIFASEDIGLAGNGALGLTNACFEAIHKVGMPEAQIILAHVVVALAKSKKSRQSYDLMRQTEQIVAKFPNTPVPTHLRNPSTHLMKNLSYGQDYQWTADFKHPKGFLPPEVKDFWQK